MNNMNEWNNEHYIYCMNEIWILLTVWTMRMNEIMNLISIVWMTTDVAYGMQAIHVPLSACVANAFR